MSNAGDISAKADYRNYKNVELKAMEVGAVMESYHQWLYRKTAADQWQKGYEGDRGPVWQDAFYWSSELARTRLRPWGAAV